MNKKIKNICFSLFLKGRAGVGLLLLLSSCKPPLPVYFDNPIGIKTQGFDTSIAGNYIPLEDVIDKGTKEFSEKYKVGYDKILPKNFSIESNGNDINYEEVKKIMGISKDSGKVKINNEKCDSIFKTVCDFNDLIFVKLSSHIDKARPSKPQAAMVKIAYDKIFFITADSLGNNSRDTLLSLGPSILLTKYSGKYFLNFKTAYGWEIMQLDVWEKKFLSARLFYFTDYDECAATISALTASTRTIYPDLKPILNKEKKVIGYKAALNPKLLLDKFKKSEEVTMFLKIK